MSKKRRRRQQHKHSQQHHNKYPLREINTSVAEPIPINQPRQKTKYRGGSKRATPEQIDLIAIEIFGPFYNDQVSEN